MLNNIISSKTIHLLIAIIVAILTTGFIRLQLFSGLPEADGGVYTFANQYIYNALINGEDLLGLPLYLYQFITSWVYSLEVNQFILLRLIDGLFAIAASIVLFKVILKESDSTLFTVILTTGLLIIMNDIDILLCMDIQIVFGQHSCHYFQLCLFGKILTKKINTRFIQLVA